MRLLLVTAIYPPEIGGPATVTPLLAQASHERGWETRVIAYGDEKTDRSGSWKLTVISKHASPWVRYGRFFREVWRQARLSDVVFLQGSFAEGVPGTVAAKLAGCPTVLRMPGGFSWERWQRESGMLISLEEFLASSRKRPRNISLMNWLEGWVARAAQCVFLPSQYLFPLLADWGVQASRLKVIYNLPEPIQVTSSKVQVREKLNLPEGATIFLTLARGIQTKRVDFLLDVLVKLPGAVLISLGEGERYAEWRAKADRLGVGDRFLTPGRVDRAMVYCYAKAADAFVLASHLENYPFAAIEMALTGLPCFLSDRGGNIEAAANFPERIELLPYENEDAWIARLRQPFSRLDPIQLHAGQRMEQKYLEEIERIVGVSR